MNSSAKRLFVPGILSLALGILTQFAPQAMSQANVQGQWQTLPYTMPINPVHAALLNNGKVLIVSGSGNVPTNKNFQAALWDPQAGTITTQPIGWDMFCNGMVVLPDGRPFIMGGTLGFDPFLGQPRTAIYDPASNSFTDQQNMARGRWYPTGVVLSDGRVMVFSGLKDTGGTNSAVEIYTVGSGWGPALAAPWTPPLYPRMHLLPNGNVFYSGSTTTSSIFNPTTNAWTLNVASTNFSGVRTYGSSVLLPLTPANGYKPRVMIFGGGNPSTATTEIIDLSAATPKWVNGPSMSQPRIEMNATILPNGKVLTLGGSLNDEDTATASLNADVYDPNANTFSAAGTEAFARLYHSISLLMPDGTVWVAGSNPNRSFFESHMEVYSPAYLFKSDGTLATRPSIASLSSSVIGYSSVFQVNTPDAASISTVVLMRNGAVTHAFNMDQRHVGLSFTTGSGVLNVTAPPNGMIAPPGFYMLFLLNTAGVPSVAKMVQISATGSDESPTGTITNPTSDVTITAGQSVSYSGSGTDPDGSITGYSWVFPGGNPATSNLANPGSITYSTKGTYVTTLTVTDSAGLTDPHPPTRTITVNGPPDFSLAVSPTLQSIAQGGNTTYTATATAGTGFTGNVSFSVSGLPSGASASFNPPSVSTSGSSTMTVSAGAATPVGSYTLTVTATSGALSHAATTALTVVKSGNATPINFGSGFSAAGMQFNGHTKLNGNRLQLTDASTVNEVASAFWTTPVNVQTFTNDFTFQLTNASADGFTFTVQGISATAIGQFGSNLGYGGTPSIGKSVAVKFDLHNNAGEGVNSTGLYTNGATPTLPAITLAGGVDLHSGDILRAHMTYDGTTLTMTLNDTAVPADTFTTSWTINIPGTVGANTAFVGFTAGTGGSTAIQEILGWTYSTGATGPPPAATPVITPATGSFTSAQMVSMTDTTSGASIFYTLDGTQPTASSTPYTVPFNVSSTTTVMAIATATNFSTSATATSVITIQSGGGTPINFGSGFTSAAGMQFNGHTKLNGTRLQLTDTTTTFQVASAFWATAVNVQTFTNDFTFQLTNPNADGFTFTLQGVGPTAIGAFGSNLGYGGTPGIAKSVAVKFDLHNNAGEGANSTGLYTNGATPTVPATTFGGGVDLHSGDIFQVHMTYDGTTLTMTITDTAIPADTFTISWPINIPATVGASTAFAGFTAGTGGVTAMQEIVTWTYGTGAGAPDFSIAASPASQTVNPGNSTTYTVTIGALSGFTGTVTLSATGLPAGANASFSPATVTTSGTSTMTVTTSGTTPLATSTLTITGTSGSLTHSATSNLVVSAAPDFSIAASPASQTVNPGNSTTYTVTIGALNGFTGTVTLSATGLPAGANASFSPATVTTSGTSTMTVTTSTSTLAGTSTLTITGTSGALAHSTTVSLVVATVVVPDFSIAVSPSTQTVIAGNSTTYTVTIGALNGFAGTVTLSASGIPNAANASFSPATVTTSGTSTMTVTTGNTTPVGTSTFTVTGTSGSLTHSANSDITVQTGSTTPIDFSSGFSATGIDFNGHTKLNGTRLQLTDTTTTFQVASAFWATAVNVQTFTNDFTFQLTNPNADGFTLTLQGVGPTAIGKSGGSLGYGGTPGIAKSVAVKFDLHNNAGEGINSTGLYINGAAPTVPAITLGGGVNLHSGDILQVHMTYNGTTLTMTITDTTIPADTFTTSWPINIPTTVGANTAFVGFTAGTGSTTATQEIITWTYSTP